MFNSSRIYLYARLSGFVNRILFIEVFSFSEKYFIHISNSRDAHYFNSIPSIPVAIAGIDNESKFN